MINHLSESIADFYCKKNIILFDEKNVYRFGISLILNDVTTFSLILFLSAIFFEFRYGVEFLLTFCFTRFFVGGYHARSAGYCRFSMLITWLCVLSFATLFRESSLSAFLAILVSSYALAVPVIPVRHPNKVLTPKLIRRGRVGGAFLYVLFTIFAMYLFIHINKQDAMTVALSLSAVSVLAIIGTFTNERRETE